MIRKNRMIRSAICAFTAAVMMTSFNGCDKNKGSNSGSEPSADSKVGNTEKAGDFTAEKITLSEEIGYIDQMFYNDGKLYIFNSSETASYNEIMHLINTDTKEKKDIDFGVTDNGYIMYAALAENRIFLAYNDSSNTARLCTYDLENNKIAADIETDSNSYISHMWAEDDGNMAALVMKYNAPAEIDIDTAETAHIVKYDGETLDVISTIDLNDKFEIAENEIIAYVNEFPDGTFYVVNIKFKENDNYDVIVRSVNANGDIGFETDDFADISGYVSGVFRSKNNNLCICKTDDDFVVHIKEIDASTGKTVGNYKVDFGGYTFLLERFVLDKYDFVYSNDNGIYGYSFKDNSSTLIFTFGDEISRDFINCYNIYSCGDNVFMHTGVYGNYAKNFILSDLNGEVQSIFDPHTDKMDICDTYAGKNGIYFVEQQDSESEGGSDMYTRSYYFHLYDETGNKKKVFQIAELDKLSSPFIQSISENSNGDICLVVQDYSDADGITMSPALYIADSDGNVKFKLIGQKDISYIKGIISAHENDYAAYTDNNGNSKYALIDYSSGKLSKDVRFDIPDDADFIAGDDEYDFYYMSGGCLYGFKVKDNISDMILDFSKTEFEPSEILSVSVVNSHKVICIVYNSETGETDIVDLSSED